jgi:hypothetical protein
MRRSALGVMTSVRCPHRRFLPQRCPSVPGLRLDRAAVRQPRPPGRTGRHRAGDRAAAELGMEGVERAQHRQGVVDRRRRVSLTQGPLAGAPVHRTRCRGWLTAVPLRVVRRAYPADQHLNLGAGRVIPGHLEHPTQPPPTQQVVAVGASRQRAHVGQHQIPQKSENGSISTPFSSTTTNGNDPAAPANHPGSRELTPAVNQGLPKFVDHKPPP